MKFAVGLGIAFIVLAAEIFVVVTFVLAPDLPSVGRDAIDRYVGYERDDRGVDLTVTRMAHATRPWLFMAAASSATFGDGPYYRTSRSYQVVTVTVTLPPGPGGGATSSETTYRSGSGGRALPYPPKEVWCVLLEDGEGRSRVVFAALHSDLYNAGWIMHEASAAPASAELEHTLSEIGCALQIGG
jgi:hypothetical protein